MPKEVPETKQGPILGGGKSGNLIGKLRDEHTEALKEYTVLGNESLDQTQANFQSHLVGWQYVQYANWHLLYG